MYFPKLIDLVTDSKFGEYSAEIIDRIDNFLGNFSQGASFNESDLNLEINNLLHTNKIISDLIELDLIEEIPFSEDNFFEGEENSEEASDKNYRLLQQPNIREDKNYLEYLKRKRQIDSFAIIYEKTKQQRSGALTLIDLKGYSKNVNSPSTNVDVLLLIEKLQNIINTCIKPYFLNSYSGIEIKHNGDGWFLYFLKETEAYEFIKTVCVSCRSDYSINNIFTNLGTTLKCYIHHSHEIEKIYKVDTLHFDMEGRDVILIHMLEKPIESELYKSFIAKTSSFIAITGEVFHRLPAEDQHQFKELSPFNYNVTDTEGNSKLGNAQIQVFYQEIK